MNTVADAEVSAYADRVRAALADLPADRREDLLADLTDHLAEVAGEDGDGARESLEARLGPPERYAAELRAAAGLPPADHRPGEPPSRRGRLADRPAVQAGLDFLRDLRPAWWVLRGLLIAAVPWLLWASGPGYLPFGLYLTFNPLYLLLPALVTVPLSVVLGRRSVADRRLRWIDIALTVVALFCLLLAAATATAQRIDPELVPSNYAPPAYGGPPGLEGVTNIHPYSSDGKPLRDVLLYDQDGNPIRLANQTTADGDPITVVPRYGADGSVVDNVYPQEQTVEEYTVELPADPGPQRRRVPAPAVDPPALQPR
jgi:hypothetical protein